MQLTNKEIYNHALALSEAFKDNSQRLPMKINFYLQKNKNQILSLGQDIENSRMDIIQHYGSLSEDGTQYILSKEQVEEADKEINDLLSLTQDVNIYMIKIDSLTDDVSLTTAQMEAMLFMIEE